MGVLSAKEELEGGQSLPEGTAHVWGWFVELSTTRQCGFTANPITWAEIHGWSVLTGVRPTLLEMKWIQMLDMEFLKVVREKVDK